MEEPYLSLLISWTLPLPVSSESSVMSSESVEGSKEVERRDRDCKMRIIGKLMGELEGIVKYSLGVR